LTYYLFSDALLKILSKILYIVEGAVDEKY